MMQDITSNVIGGLIVSVVGGLFVLGLRLYARRRDQSMTKKELILDIKNKTYRPTALVLSYTLVVLQLAWTAAFFSSGSIFLKGADDFLSFAVMIFIIMAIVVIPVSIRLYHRLQVNHAWIKPFIIIVTFFAIIIEVTLINRELPPLDPEALLGFSVFIGFVVITLLPGLYIGQYLARKTQSEFTMAQLFKRLSVRDKKELIELVDSLPSAQRKKSE